MFPIRFIGVCLLVSHTVKPRSRFAGPIGRRTGYTCRARWKKDVPEVRRGTAKPFPTIAGAAIGLALLGSAVSQLPAGAQSVPSTGAVAPVSSHRLVLDRYCVTCHNERLKTAGLTLDQIDVAHPGQRAEEWEKVVRKLRTGAMPPSNAPQPSAQDRTALVSWLESSLDTAAAAHPNPGRTDTLRRLNRTEYQNAIRDLLSLDIDAASLLPPDDSGHGFDNVTVGDLSPALLDRYISTAQKISRLAIGGAQTSAETDVIRVPPDLTQEEHVPGLPVGTRGGMSSPHTFTHDGEYDIQIWLARDRTGSVGGLRGSASHELLVLVDRTLVKAMTIEMPADGDDTSVDADAEGSCAGHGRLASGGRHVSQEWRVAPRNGAAAPPVAFQREPSSPSHPCDCPGVDYGTVCGEGCRRHADPPAHLRLPAQ